MGRHGALGWKTGLFFSSSRALPAFSLGAQVTLVLWDERACTHTAPGSGRDTPAAWHQDKPSLSSEADLDWPVQALDEDPCCVC